MKNKSAILFATVFALTLGGCDDKGSIWYPTRSGAIRINSFDYIVGQIEINNAFKQEEICKKYTNELEDDSSAGINGAVDPSSAYDQREYYYYKTEAYVDFYKDREVGFKLTLAESPEYYRQPRIVPNLRLIQEKLGDLSIASQMQVTQALKDEKGNPREFTAQELAGVLERAAGKQEFDLTKWVVSNLFDKDEQTFMACIPNADKLVEKPYTPDQEKLVRDQLTDAEKTMRAIIAKGHGLFSLDSIR